jgi:hypothetical protein
MHVWRAINNWLALGYVRKSIKFIQKGYMTCDLKRACQSPCPVSQHMNIARKLE